MGILDKTKYYRREIGEVNFKPEELHVIAIVLEIPLEKIGKAIDIERCVEWLIKDEYTTGQVISINGGWNI